MATNIGPVKKESPLPQETVSEVPAPIEQQPVPEQAQEVVEVGQETEVQPETQGEQIQEVQDETQVVDAPVTTPIAAPAPVQALDPDELTVQINTILEEDLMDMYLAMPADKQEQFKAKGEETASKIRELASSAKVNAKKVFHLIRAWLKIIPGVNRFFLEQEAKIKTDKILLVTEEEKKRQQNGL